MAADSEIPLSIKSDPPIKIQRFGEAISGSPFDFSVLETSTTKFQIQQPASQGSNVVTSGMVARPSVGHWREERLDC